MKKVLIIFLFLLLGGTLSAKKVIAVMDFSSEVHYRSLSKTAANILVSELASKPIFTVIERSRLKKILDEQGLAMTGLLDDSKAAEVGKLLAANYLIMGHISSLGRGFIVTSKMVNVQTGAISAAPKVSVSSERALQGAIQELANKIVAAAEGRSTAATDSFKVRRDFLVQECRQRKPEKCFELAIFTWYGKGGVKNAETALNNFVASCVFGKPKGCFYAAQMYNKGIGSRKNPSKARQFYEKACRAGFKAACGRASKPRSNGAFGDSMLGGGNANNSIGITAPSAKQKGGFKENIIPSLEP
ncbi:hypothetical protein KAH37_03050 [bacterium]|nr:hypothetical protein [bacterium]